MNFEALISYLPFADSYSSFTFDKDSASYTCDKLTVNGITYENISIMFNASKNLTSIDYFVQNDTNGKINVSIWVSAHGSATVPEKK